MKERDSKTGMHTHTNSTACTQARMIWIVLIRKYAIIMRTQIEYTRLNQCTGTRASVCVCVQRGYEKLKR